jgi:hypothetical protein
MPGGANSASGTKSDLAQLSVALNSDAELRSGLSDVAPADMSFAIVVCQGASDLFAVHCKSANCVEHRILLERNVDRLCGTIVYARLKCRWP